MKKVLLITLVLLFASCGSVKKIVSPSRAESTKAAFASSIEQIPLNEPVINVAKPVQSFLCILGLVTIVCVTCVFGLRVKNQHHHVKQTRGQAPREVLNG